MIFNWFKKSAQAVEAVPEAVVRGNVPVTQQAIRESEAFKDQGNAHLSNGKLQHAAECFRQAIARNSRNAEAYTNLGYVFQVQGNLGEAVTLYRKALGFNPELLTAHQNLGFALLNLGQLAAAEESLHRVVALAPGHAAAWQSLGVIAAQRGDFVRAETMLRRALELQPEYFDAHNNLGNLLMEVARPSEAEASFRRALELKPDHVEAHYNMGILLMNARRLSEAEACYRRVLQLKPDYVEAHCGLGNVCKQTSRPVEAEACYRRAVELKPDYVEALNNLGNLLIEVRQLSEAEACFRRALDAKPEFAEAHSNLGNSLRGQGRIVEAEASYRRALQIKPDFAEGQCSLGDTLRYLGRLDEAETCYRRALQIKPDFTEAYNNLLFSMNYSNKNVAQSREEALRYGRMATGKAAAHFSSWQCVDQPVRLRVGLVSGDLCEHPVGYFLEGLLLNIDPARVELLAYPSHHKVDVLTARIKPCFTAWKPLHGQSDEVAAKMIHDDGVHILIDLSGHTAHNRLPVFARRPAPVQVSWLGYFATTGVAEMDYFIADSLTLPESEEVHFTEKIWRLPETRLCFTAPDVEVPVSRLPALDNGYVTFACFNNLAKMNDAVVALWARILAAVPGSYLFLKAEPLKELSVRQNVIARFVARGVSADKLILEGFAPRGDYLAAYHRVDIALDPFPYTGGTTTAEAIWMGVPVLTLAGDRIVSRQGVGLLTNAGLPEWIAFDADDYVARAVAHAGDLPRLAKLRGGLRQQVLASPVFDAPRFARHFESALSGMWEKWCGKQ
jgi:predicted O-linked N-acetylglucosamine transferase (SPINDLY family)